jgi:multicomponent Na+:H+ antiporter subunit D
VGSSLIAVIYIWRVIESAYFREPPEDLINVKEAPLSLLIPAWVLVLGNVYFGVETSLPLSMAELAAKTLMGGS